MDFAPRMLLGLCVVGLLCGTAHAGTSNSLMDISTDGSLLACSNRDSGSVTIVALPSLDVLHEVAVGHHPEGVTFVGNSHDLAVAVYGDDKIVGVDSATGTVTWTLDVFDEPYGVVSTSDGSRLFATLEYPGQVIAIDAGTHEISDTWDVGKMLRGICLNTDESQVIVTEYITGIAKAVDASSGEITREWVGTTQDSLARQVAAHPQLEKLYIPHQRSRTAVAHGSGSIFPYVAILDTNPETDPVRKRVQMDSINGTYVVANPWEVALSPGGDVLYVVFSGTDDMFTCEVVDDNYRELRMGRLIQLGANPRAVRASPDGERFYVYEALDFRVSAFDANTLNKVGEVSVCECPLSEELLLGKRLFYTARSPMSARRWISCSSCHPDGDADGQTWQQPEGLRQTQPLFGLGWTHPLHWSADRDEVQDFEHTIRGLLMQGRGLARGPISDSLEDPNSGLSNELDALAAYTNSHQFSLSPHAKEGLSESAGRGRELFFSSTTGCADCHSGPLYCDSRPDWGRLHDVGTGADDTSELMGTEYDTPTLLGIYRSAPYLHTGEAATLEEVLTTCNPDDRHGHTSHLTADQVHDLAEFLRALPYEDCIPAAQAENWPLMTSGPPPRGGAE